MNAHGVSEIQPILSPALIDCHRDIGGRFKADPCETALLEFVNLVHEAELAVGNEQVHVAPSESIPCLLLTLHQALVLRLKHLVMPNVPAARYLA